MSAKRRPWYSDGLRFTCTACGKCCVNHGEDYAYVYLAEIEIDALAAHFGLERDAFLERYTTTDQGEVVLLDNGDRCIFLDDAMRCTVYPARPRQCRTWPFWRENLDRKEWDGPIRDVCPGVGTGALYTRDEIEAIADWTDAVDDPDADQTPPRHYPGDGHAK